MIEGWRGAWTYERNEMGKRKSKKRSSRSGSGRPSPATRSRVREKKRPPFIAIGVVVIVITGIVTYIVVGKRSSEGPTVDVRVPELSSLAQRGARAFEASCARCHGSYAGGTANGPPLVHRFYEPSHHGDAAIRLAVRRGVSPHHWKFGPMPKIDVSDRQLDGIIAFVRELQRVNGIR